MVARARNRMTVMLSMNIASAADSVMNATRILTGSYLTALARVRQSHLKKPACPMPSIMTIIPPMNRIVAQLIPLDSSVASCAAYQNDGWKMFLNASVSMIACGLRMQTPKTRTIIRRPAPRVIRCRGIFSMTIITNMTMKILTARICVIKASSFE